MAEGIWQVWADTGGTFTDCIAAPPNGGPWRRAKVLSSGALRGTVEAALSATVLRVRTEWSEAPLPADFVRGLPLILLGRGGGAAARIAAFDPAARTVTLAEPLPARAGDAFEARFGEEAPLVACRVVTGTPAGAPLPPIRLRLATTRGTNALLTRQGTPPVFVVTEGFADVLEIGTQQRPDLFALDIVKPAPLYGAVVEVRGRLAADGAILIPLDEDRLRADARRLAASGFRTAAVALLHSYRAPEMERRVGEILREAGFTHVTLSAEVAPRIKVLPRAQTAVVDAYLAPVVGGYLDAVTAGLADERSAVQMMTSAGGLVGAASFRAKDSLLSGPAGGIVGAAASARRAGFDRLIAFDMGGTSTDVARYDGDFEYAFEHGVGDAHLFAPALAIESVAAGGGSICFGDARGLRVGPESAGAQPGPACYGAGGPLTVTDVNLLLGRLLPDRFEIPLDVRAADAAAGRLLGELAEAAGRAPDRDALLEGLLEIANERMADAIRRVSLRRGYDPRDHALVSFGGAGGQHCCAVAAKLGIVTVIVPPDASLLSALGLGHAALERFAERQVLRELGDGAAGTVTEAAVHALLDDLGRDSCAAVDAESSDGAGGDPATVRRRLVELRLAGQESTLTVEADPAAPLGDAFARRYEAVFGHPPPDGKPVEVESARAVASRAGAGWERQRADESPVNDAVEPPTTRARFGGAWRDVPAVERERLSPERKVAGPALIVERFSAVALEPGWTASVDAASGALILRASRGAAVEDSTPDAAAIDDPVQQELFAARFTAVAEEMGEALRRTALSTNVKERLDFSCALLDPDGRLVASAAHIPVHLGALGACVRAVKQAMDLGPGDVAVTNHPAFGGSHLPDVTVIAPAHDGAGRLLGYVASRAHHAEIGGTRPGSMPPDAATLAEEGVVLPPTYLVRAGESRLGAVCDLLRDAPYPSRAVADNRADLEAALAAGHRGLSALVDLAGRHGAETVLRHMDAQIARAEALLRRALAALPDGTRMAVERLDDGAEIAVAIAVAGDSAVVDFTGTAPARPGNLNAPPAVVASAVLYVLRLLAHEPIPLNEGLLRPVRLVLPEGSLVNPPFDPADPARCPAVVGGNTEVSQRVVDTLLKALGLAACSQGTMNNVLFGADAFGYYETVCGGAGATANAPGASMVHTHMTNTRITDPEILEFRYPVRLERFARRAGSGGVGRHPGGDGVLRELTFLAPVALSVLTQHRAEGPYGLAGGEPGAPGRQRLVRADGAVLDLASADAADVQPGDRLILETPGGGGWGSADG